MVKALDVAVIVGSLRKESFNRKIALNLADLAPKPLVLEIVEIGRLPLYNQDYDAASPPEYTSFRARIKRADAVLFVTPEHDRSMPAALKNALDIGGRPWGQNVWAGKPAGIVSASIAATGGFGANHHLRQSLTYLDTPTMLQPEAYLGKVDTLLDDQGKINNDRTRKFLRAYIEAYAAWVSHFVHG
ncbi:MAG TPA: NAD(P)H-dependent oxidoreductase [Rhodanobacteraceae bacterium]|nr:NAD(P)H-dependent oxidoreductase [Rhodanobacteraceae bacterium]